MAVFKLTANAAPAATYAGFTCIAFSIRLSFAGLVHARYRKSARIGAAGLLWVWHMLHRLVDW